MLGQCVQRDIMYPIMRTAYIYYIVVCDASHEDR